MIYDRMMDIMRQIMQICLFLSATCLIMSIVQHHTVQGTLFLSKIKIWNKHIEVSAKTLHVNAGSRVSLKCDAIYSNEAHLRWYGPNRHVMKGDSRRIRVEEARSKHFLKLTIFRVQAADEGEYICRAWFTQEDRFVMKPIRLVVVNTTPSPTTTTATTTRVTPALVESSTNTITTTTSHAPAGSCSPLNFLCGNGVCIDGSSVCDNFPDCVDGSDELDCGTHSFQS